MARALGLEVKTNDI
jgi:hypothetical protein